ncbi:MAG: hypothetical protein HYS34_00350 [Acidobacteria bacterium]|nr:hypothetical protein [Acidobacteriota bacterium]
MRSRSCATRRLAGAAAGAALVLLFASPAAASVFYDVTLNLGLGEDQRIFLNVTNDYFAPPAAVATTLVQRCPSPVDDYPVILLLARSSKRSPDEILRLRLDYLSWSDIMFRLNISPSVLFTGIDRDPGPPYGKAWGYWKKHPRERLVIRDRDVAGLAKLQVAARRHKVSPYTLIAERNKGVTIEHYVAEKNRGKYPKARTAKEKARGAQPGKEKGQPKEHGRPHQDDRH